MGISHHEKPVVVVGAGLAGLNAARAIAKAGRSCLVLEASDGVGGRVRTDRHEGFLLDRGFQVLLTAYPECRRVLRYESLDLRDFYPGAMVRFAGDFHLVADPWKKPVEAAGAFLSPIATISDKIRLGLLRQKLVYQGSEQLWSRPEETALDLLRDAGFSNAAIDRFFRAFFGGTFFDRSLQTSARMLAFTFRMFNSGRITIPAGGIGVMSEHLASLTREAGAEIRLGARVERIEEHSGEWRVHVAGVPNAGVAHGMDAGNSSRPAESVVAAAGVVVATEGDCAAELLRGAGVDADGVVSSWAGTTTLYFDAPASPVARPILVLDGDAEGPVNHMCVPSMVSPTYAPPGRHLISLTAVHGIREFDSKSEFVDVVGESEEHFRRRSLAQMRRWFGDQVNQWRHLRTDFIPRAVPDQRAGRLEPAQRDVRLAPGLFVCGDHRDNASFNGAMESGRRAAEAVLAESPLAGNQPR